MDFLQVSSVMKMYISKKTFQRDITPLNELIEVVFMHNPTVIYACINVQKALRYHKVTLVIPSDPFNIRSALLKNNIMNLYHRINQPIVCTLANPEPKLRI